MPAVMATAPMTALITAALLPVTKMANGGYFVNNLSPIEPLFQNCTISFLKCGTIVKVPSRR